MEDLKRKKVARLTAVCVSVIVSLVLSGVATVIAGNSFAHEIPSINAIASIFTGIVTACVTLCIALVIVGYVFDIKIAKVIGVMTLFFAFIFLIVILGLFSARWWIMLILALISIPVLLFAIMLIYRKQLVLVTDDEKPGYEDWKTREAKKSETAKEEVKEELPELKSFK